MKERFIGLEPHMPRVFQKLAEIFEHQVFELCIHESNYLIPYMMNDAVEDYLILKNCRMVGEYLLGDEIESVAHIGIDHDGYVLVVRQNDENVFTLYFKEIEESINYYQYHNIGHFWVKGQEQWRQLVYIIGTIYDKYEYQGETACNDDEMELLPLIEFAPFRAFSPVHMSLEEKYPPTYDGINAMEAIAKSAGDDCFVRWVKIYRRIPTRWMEKILSRKMQSKRRQALYDYIFEKVKRASIPYDIRDYGKEINVKITHKRQEIHQMMIDRGFQGTYPEYYADGIQVFVTEEQPFTLMEFQNYKFRMQFMVSKCGKFRTFQRNCGFFCGMGRKGFILSEEEMKKIKLTF